METTSYGASGAFDNDLDDLFDFWTSLTSDEKRYAFHQLGRTAAEQFFLNLSPEDQALLLGDLTTIEKRSWIKLLAPDDAADLMQNLEHDQRAELLGLLDHTFRAEVTALLAYAEDDAGGLMNSRYFRLRPEMTTEQAINYIRAQAKTGAEGINYAYVLDSDQTLRGVLSLRELFIAPPGKAVTDLMRRDLTAIPEQMDQEEVSRVFAQSDLMAIPVVDEAGKMKGIVTLDDIVDVVRDEATEDIQKLGAVETLDAPYFDLGFLGMVRKRAVWLTVLFLGEMLTTSAMGHYEAEIQQAVVLAMFIPLIISSGGNSGSQATTLIIRAMALHEVRVSDWFRVFFRELLTGASLGLILGVIGFLRIALWPNSAAQYGPHYVTLALAVSASLVGVVLWGSLMGSMLPFLLKALRLDPASASAPFVATLVDVTGLVIYFSTAKLLLGGVLF